MHQENQTVEFPFLCAFSGNFRPCTDALVLIGQDAVRNFTDTCTSFALICFLAFLCCLPSISIVTSADEIAFIKT